MTQHTTQNSRRAAGLEDLFTILNYSRNSTPGTHTPSHPPTPTPMSSTRQSAQPEPAHTIPRKTHIKHTDNASSNKTPDETPDETLPVAPEDTDAVKFISAIHRIIQARPSTSKPKLQEPEPFDGSDPKKLHIFIFQCKLNFRDHKDLFHNKETKVKYALSYLKGITLDCFKPALLDLHDPIWLSNFGLFVTELENNFGTFDPEGEAEAELEALRMHENHQATKYFIKFQQLATRVQWGDAARLT